MNDHPTNCICGNPIDPETLELAKYWARLPLFHCSECQQRSDEGEARRAADEKQKIEEATRIGRLEIIKPELRRTQINHPGFNPALWLKVEHWTPDSLKWLGIVGLPGTCKTRSLALLAKRLILDGHLVFWARAVDFQSQVENLRSNDRQVEAVAREYIRACKTCGLLIFDDIGKNTWTPSLERHMFDLIDHRKDEDLPVLWSANTHPLDILRTGLLTKERGGPLLGRLLEASRIERS
ncbi:MAG: hypothetical protein V4819_00995 [Verrucomicrobiota bacterium]